MIITSQFWLMLLFFWLTNDWESMIRLTKKNAKEKKIIWEPKKCLLPEINTHSNEWEYCIITKSLDVIILSIEFTKHAFFVIYTSFSKQVDFGSMIGFGSSKHIRRAARVNCGLFICDFSCVQLRNGLFYGTNPLIYSCPWSFLCEFIICKPIFGVPISRI